MAASVARGARDGMVASRASASQVRSTFFHSNIVHGDGSGDIIYTRKCEIISKKKSKRTAVYYDKVTVDISKRSFFLRKLEGA